MKTQYAITGCGINYAGFVVGKPGKSYAFAENRLRNRGADRVLLMECRSQKSGIN